MSRKDKSTHNNTHHSLSRKDEKRNKRLANKRQREGKSPMVEFDDTMTLLRVALRIWMITLLDMVKKATGVDLDELNKSVNDMDSILCDALAKMTEHYEAAEKAFEKVDNVCPGCPDGEDGFGELTDKEAEAEYEKYRLVTAYHKAAESALYNLVEMKLELESLTNG